MLISIVITETVVAGIFVFTTNSPFNQLQFTDYVIEGTPIIPFVGSVGNSSLTGDITNGSAWVAH